MPALWKLGLKDENTTEVEAYGGTLKFLEGLLSPDANKAWDAVQGAEELEDKLREAGFPAGTTVEPPYPRWDAAAPPARVAGAEAGVAWGLNQIGFAALRAKQRQTLPNRRFAFDRKSRFATVAVIGSGVDWTHPALVASMWINEGEIPGNGKDDDHNGFVDDRHGWNFHRGTPDVSDCSGHDTLVAGIIAAPGAEVLAPRAEQTDLLALRRPNYKGRAAVVGAGRLNALRALQTDPNHFLEAKIVRVEWASGSGARGLAVYGAAGGTDFAA